MTCIVSVRDNQRVIIGADSCVSMDDRTDVMGAIEQKVTRIGDILFAMCGDTLDSQIITKQIEIPKHDPSLDDMSYIIKIANAIKVLLKNNSRLYLCNKRNQLLMRGQILIGYNGQSYLIDNDFGVLESLHDFQSIGSGSHYALGSLATTVDSKDIRYRTRVALEAAQIFDAHVSGPFVFLESEKMN